VLGYNHAEGHCGAAHFQPIGVLERIMPANTFNGNGDNRMKRLWTIIAVANVTRSFAWYQSLLGLPATAPSHDYFGQIAALDGTVLLCLHAWEAHGHPSLTGPEDAKPGNGLLLFFRVDNYDAALANARALAPQLEEEPHLNPATGTLEFSLRDPDGYYVSISALEPPATSL
jgi:catechol 2,3-dioxygenase-like lactoylglutathione lyase family enzyme